MHPMLAAFDAPSREDCTADRFQSNSPQQALALLNDPTFVEAARAFALRLQRENPEADDGEKIRHAMNLALARDREAGRTRIAREHSSQASVIPIRKTGAMPRPS